MKPQYSLGELKKLYEVRTKLSGMIAKHTFGDMHFKEVNYMCKVKKI